MDQVSRQSQQLVCSECSVDTRHVCRLCQHIISMLRDHTDALGLVKQLLELHSRDLINIQKDLLRRNQ